MYHSPSQSPGGDSWYIFIEIVCTATNYQIIGWCTPLELAHPSLGNPGLVTGLCSDLDFYDSELV